MNTIPHNDSSYILNTYSRYPIIVKSASGAYIYDNTGKQYLDFLSGISVCNLGHSHQKITKALHEQLNTLIHCSNLYYTHNQITLAQKISELSFQGKTFFTNSGTEANEAALKFMRYHGSTLQKDKNVILSLKGSFHGRSLGSLSLTGQETLQQGFEPLLPNIHYVKPNSIEDLKTHFTQNVAGIIIEVIQGEKGIYPLNKDFVHSCRLLAKQYDALLIIDEIQSGMGRTGRFLAYEHYDIQPDGFTLSKALGNGIPIGAFHIHKNYADLFQEGMHGSTFGGNPFATRAGIEVLSILHPEIIQHVQIISKTLHQAIQQLIDRYSFLKAIRGQALMLALSTDINARNILDACHSEGLLVNAIQENTLRLLPPLIIREQEVTLFYDKMKRICAQF